MSVQLDQKSAEYYAVTLQKELEKEGLITNVGAAPGKLFVYLQSGSLKKAKELVPNYEYQGHEVSFIKTGKIRLGARKC